MNDTYILYTLIGFALFLTLLSFFLSMKTLKMRKKIKTLTVAYSKIESLIALKEDHKIDNNIHKESFIKFLSDSRDWAYEYIEKVQTGINKFVSDVEPEITYFKEYGDLGSMAPNYYSMKKITESYEELKKLLPEEDK